MLNELPNIIASTTTDEIADNIIGELLNDVLYNLDAIGQKNYLCGFIEAMEVFGLITSKTSNRLINLWVYGKINIDEFEEIEE